MTAEEILAEIENKSGMSRQEIQDKIQRKLVSMSGLISAEGAAHLVAKDLGVELVDQAKRKLEMKNIVSGMKNVNVAGRVFRVSNINEFKRQDGSSGKVVNLFVGDSTDYVKVALWNDQVSLVEDGTIKAGDAIHIINGFSKENAFGDIEVSLGKYGSIKPDEDDGGLPDIDEMSRMFGQKGMKKMKIEDIDVGQADITATIIDVFGGNFIFGVCPTCKSKLDGESCCNAHGKVEPESAMVLSATADDGTGSIRMVMFRDVAENMTGLKAADLAKMERDKRLETARENILGREIQLLGVVKKNNMSGNLELIVNGFKEINTIEESKKLIDGIELKVVG